jgi:hypothetical protein
MAMTQTIPKRIEREPVIAAWGAGVNSTAMIIELISQGQAPDIVLMADPGAERPQTYAYIPVFSEFLKQHHVPLYIVSHTTTRFKNWPPYKTLEENSYTNGTLPSKAFGRGACSVKYKIAPQNAWTETWQPAIEAWARGQKVRKLIGYDTSPSYS